MLRSIFCYWCVKSPDNLNPKDLPLFIPPLKTGKVIKVYDGDTITIASRVPGLYNSPIYKFSVRLNGIDSPEMKGKTLTAQFGMLYALGGDRPVHLSPDHRPSLD